MQREEIFSFARPSFFLTMRFEIRRCQLIAPVLQGLTNDWRYLHVVVRCTAVQTFIHELRAKSALVSHYP